MATNNNIDVQALQAAINMMAKAVGMGGFAGTSSAASNSSAYNNYANSYNKKYDDKEYEKLNNIIKNNGDMIQQLTLMFKNLSKKGKNMEGLYDELNSTTKKLNDTQRKAALAVADIIAKNTKTSQEAIKALQNLSQFAEQSKDNIKKSNSALSSLDKAVEQRAKAIAERNRKEKAYDIKITNQQQAVQGATTPEEKRRLNRQLSSFKSAKKRSLGSSDNQINKLDKSIQDLNNTYDETIKKIEELNDITGSLTKAEIDYLKNMKKINASARQSDGIFDKLQDGISGIEKGSGVAAENVVKNSEKLGKGLSVAAGAAKLFGSTLLRMIPGLVHDMMARDRYNVQGTDYFGSIARGVSEQERYALIDQNRLQLRTLGGGNEVQGFQNTKALQQSAHMFGVYGAEAIQKALEYQKTTGAMGISYSNVGATQTQMAFMKTFAQQIGASNDQLKDFYNSLQDMGEISAMSQQFANKSDQERQNSINQEIYTRTKLNTALGISLDMQKQMQQQAVNQRYAGLSTLIKQGIGAHMRVDNFNNSASGANKISNADADFYSNVFQAGGIQTLTDPNDIKRYSDISKKINLKDQGDLRGAQQQAAKGNTDAMYGQSIFTGILGQMGIDRQSENNTWGNIAQQGKALGNNAVDNTKDFNSTMMEATKTMNGPDGFTAAVYKATEVLHGFSGGNVVGSGLANIAGGAAGWLGGKALSKAAGWLGGKGASGALGSIGGVASKVSPILGKFNLLRGLGGGLAAFGINKLFGDADTISEGNDDLASQGLRGVDYLSNAAMSSGYLPAMGVGLAAKGGLRVGNATSNLLNKSENWQDIRDVMLGSTIGGVQALFGDNTGWNQAKMSASALGDRTKAFFGFGDDNSNVQTPTKTLANQLSQQMQQNAANDDGDEALGYLKDIAKSNKDMNERDNKNDQQQQTKDAQSQNGSAYAEYQKHLSEVVKSFAE